MSFFTGSFHLRISFQHKLLFIFTLFTFLIISSLCTFFIVREISQTKQTVTEQLNLQANALAQSIRLPLFAENIELLEQMAGQVADLPEIHAVTINAPNGRLLVDLRHAGQIDRAEIVSQIVEVRSDPQLGSVNLALGSTFDSQQSRLGTLRIDRTTTDLSRNIRNMVAWSVTLSVLFWLLVTSLSYLVLRKVTRSLNALMAGITALQQGDYEARIEVMSADEPGQAASAVNDLASALQQRYAEKKRNQEELMQAKIAAESASVAKTEFLANISHEIRTPMSGVIGNAQLLRFTSLTEDQEKFLSNIETDAKALLSLVNDLLDISKIEAGRLEIDSVPFSLNCCIAEVIRSQSARVQDKALVLNSRIDEQIPNSLCGDPLRLKQILYNLVGNAVKFTSQGEIQVTVDLLERDNDTVRLCFKVMDTGIGIKSELLEKIFEPFSQADTSIARRFGGTGLGLSICNRLVNQMGGALSVASTEGKGSTFLVTLSFPINKQVTELPQMVERDCGAPLWEGRPLQILLAEDNQTNRIMISRLLSHFGHSITEVGDGAAVLDLLESEDFDVILMDIQMPVMDGIKATLMIRSKEQESGRHIPVIALTAHALDEQREYLLETGFDGYVSKPVDLAALHAEMKRVLDDTAK